MENLAIAWETVSVTRGVRDFELAVRLSGDSSADWESLFNQAAEQWGLSIEGSGWNHVRVDQCRISMRELQPQAREQARRYLDDLVSRTNAALAAKLEQEEQERIRLEQEEAELERTAAELTSWFRSGAAAPTAAPPQPTLAEGDEHAQLRDRLVHSFRPDAA